MKLFNDNIEENLRFQLLEVQSQIERTASYINEPSHELLNLILSRDSYIDNLKMNIQRKCFQLATGEKDERLDTLNAVNIVTSNLERIADYCGNIVKQVTYIDNTRILNRYDFTPFFSELISGVSLVHKAVAKGDVKTAISICKIEETIDNLYAEVLNKALKELKSSNHTRSLVTIIFIARYLERMGDSLLNIGEAIISAFLGEQIKIEQLDVLEKSLRDADLNPKISDLTLKAMGETRSGCKIDLVSSNSETDTDTMTIFKEGQPEKLQREKAGVNYWDALMPGITPKIYAHRQEGDTAALLLEYLNGDTYEEILLNGTAAEFSKAQGALQKTLSSVWAKTRRDEQKPSHFVQQIRDRLDSVYAVHPGFSAKNTTFGDMSLPSFTSLLDEVKNIEKDLFSPFSVLTHGDFNIDNIIFEKASSKIRLIDLHRSTHRDYVQDISVFMISNFRLPVFDAKTRRRINKSISTFYLFSSDEAKRAKDKTFNIRLALGLARSLVTSTRFVLDKDIARDMQLRSRYLMEAVVRAKPQHYTRFKIPEGVIIA